MLRGVPALLASLFISSWLVPSHEALAIPELVDESGQLFTDREEVIVNGSVSGNAIRQRGAVIALQIPPPDTFSAERLLSQHALPLTSPSTCARQFCLIAETIDAQLLAQPEARYLLGLRFDSVTARTPAQRPPVNLVAVVDASESMQDTALELTKASLVELVRQLRPHDQLSIVVYGSTARTHIGPTLVTAKGYKRLLAAIDKLHNREAASSLVTGLSFGLRLAHAAGNDFTGSSRVMLFTDERLESPGLAEALVLAERGAQLGVGLTSVGVGTSFEPQLAASLGSVRGGNQVFIRDTSELARVFGTELHTLLNELAHDVRISISPTQGYRIAGVYGVPGAQVYYAAQHGVEIVIPSAFLGFRAGQLFVSLARLSDANDPPSEAADESLARVALRYMPPSGNAAQTESLLVAAPFEPSPALQLGRLLIDEFTSLRRASIAYHIEQDRHAAFEHLRAFAPRLRNSRFPGLDRDRLLVNALEEQLAFLSGHANQHTLVRSHLSRLWGVWRVRSIQGRSEFRANERIEFTPDNKFRCFEKESGRHIETSVASISTSRQQIVMEDSGVVFNYEVRGTELVLEDRPGTLVFLQRSRLD